MAATVTNTYGKNVDDAATVYFALLAQYPLPAVANAITQHCARGNGSFPTVADIVKGIEGDIDERAALAWAEVDAAAQKTGGDRSVRFPDPAIHWAVLKMRGWESLGWRIKGDGGWLKRDFEQYYRVAVKQHVTWADVPAVLEGTFPGKVYDVVAGKSFPLHDLPALEATA